MTRRALRRNDLASSIVRADLAFRMWARQSLLWDAHRPVAEDT
jgi:hypothetical protein